MKFSLNYSHQAVPFVQAGQIQIDFFKCPDWPDLIAEARTHRPVAVHFNLVAGSGLLAQRINWQHVEHWLEETHTPYVNLHLEPRLEDYPGCLVDTPRREQYNQVVERLTQDVQAVVQHFGAERVIVENVPYRGPAGKVMRPAVEPAVLRQLLSDTGCGLLLDISHARIAAHTLNIAPYDYMQELPVQQLCELHFTGLHLQDGRLEDHLPVLETDWPVLQWVLHKIQLGEWRRPWMLAFEYGGVGERFAWRSDAHVIATQAPRLYDLVHAL